MALSTQKSSLMGQKDTIYVSTFDKHPPESFLIYFLVVVGSMDFTETITFIFAYCHNFIQP